MIFCINVVIDIKRLCKNNDQWSFPEYIINIFNINFILWQKENIGGSSEKNFKPKI